MSAIPILEAGFKDVTVNGKYHVQMPAHIADLLDWEDWERERCYSMEANLKKGDILFDIGAETGWASAIYAKFVGPENMVLFEPNPENWQNIKATWDASKYLAPRVCRIALVSDIEREPDPGCQDYEDGYSGVWPKPAMSGKVWTVYSHRHIHEDGHRVPQVTLDTFVASTGIIPRALTIDVEGAEGKVIRGAGKTLAQYRPLVWVSIHPAPMMQNYGITVREMHDFLTIRGYKAEFLGFDHEIHVLYRNTI